MPRIPFDELLPMVDRFVGHWTDLNTLPGGPFESEPGYGLPQLTTQRTELHTQLDGIGMLEQQRQQLADERDFMFGTSNDQPDSWWSKLLLYKPAVLLRLGRQQPLVGSIPNLGKVEPGTLLGIVHRYLNHWLEVNVTLGATPLTLGTKTVADLQTMHTALDAKLNALGVLNAITLPRERAQREQLSGDVDEAHRLPTSIISHLEGYQTFVHLNHAGTPQEASLPDIFPAGAAGLPRFKFNWRDLGGGLFKLWLIDPSLPNVAVVYLKEGAFEQTLPYGVPPGSTNAFVWNNVTVVDELDAVELHAADGTTVARGDRDPLLTEV